MTRTIRFHMPNRWCFYGLLFALAAPFAAAQTAASSSKPVDASASAAADYQRYCALCHGENREGYKADHAPSLPISSYYWLFLRPSPRRRPTYWTAILSPQRISVWKPLSS